MANFFKKKADVLNHWIAFAPGFQLSASEFYRSLEKEIEGYAIPKMQLSRIDFAEGGLLSEKRVYLRMVRERMVFDICAAPFGTGYFFSCRTAEIPIVVNFLQLLLCLLFLFLGLTVFTSYLGIFKALLLFTLGLTVCIYTLRNLVAMGLQDLDATLTKSPLVGSIYCAFFRKETYHRIDSRLCYLHIIPLLVKNLAEDMTGAKGVKLSNQYELHPGLGESYKPAASSDLPSLDTTPVRTTPITSY